MTECSATPKKRKNNARSSALKSPRIYIDPDDFHLMRRRAFLTTPGLLDVTHRTLQNWEKGRVRIPYTAYRVLKIKVGYVFDDEYFNDWFVRGDTLWTPEGRGFKPHELRYISNYFWMARRWLAERKAAKDVASLKLTSERGVASNGSSTLRAGTLPLCGAAPLHDKAAENALPPSFQEKTPEFEKFLRELGITA